MARIDGTYPSSSGPIPAELAGGPMGLYALHAPEYIDAGVTVFPVNTREKRPAVRGWQKATLCHSRAWAHDQLGNSDGLGVLMGRPSGITEIDVDAVGEAWISAAVERFGETPIIIRTASGKGKLWYRHNGEGRSIRPLPGQPIDVLGRGFTIAPPSRREDLGAAYTFISGSVADVAKLPTIRPEALVGSIRAAEGVQTGGRNDSLWRWCMAAARHCDDVEALIDAAEAWASAYPDPLPRAEVERCARSAMRYETTGRNFLGRKRPQLTGGDVVMDNLIDQPDAFALYHLLQRWHRNGSTFAIAPAAMSAADNPPWHRTRITRARDVLLERGYIKELKAPIRGRRAGRYQFAAQMPDSGKDHCTPFPPGGAGERRLA